MLCALCPEISYPKLRCYFPASLRDSRTSWSVVEGSGVCEIHRGDTKIGEVVLGPGDRIRKGKWRAEAAFAQTELCRAAYYMLNGQLYVPSAGKVGKVPITSLMNLAGAGPDRRDIHDGFNHTETKTAYPALWGQDTELVQSIAHKPNSFLSPLHKPKKG